VITLRCTRKLLARLRAPVEPHDLPPTTKLGDWYANLLYVPGGQLVLFVSERSLLPVIVPAREARTLVDRFKVSLREVLSRLGADVAAIDRELAEMERLRLGKTASRQVLGSMTDFAFMLEASASGTFLIDDSLWLAQTPCGPIGMKSPRDVAVGLLRS
jgi:hypothetical protein